MQQTEVVTVTHIWTSLALLKEISSLGCVPINLARKWCLAFIWLTEKD